jgi:hypothetical protein
MARIRFHASHEQFSPSDLLRLAQAAEAAGLDCAMKRSRTRSGGNLHLFDSDLVQKTRHAFLQTTKSSCGGRHNPRSATAGQCMTDLGYDIIPLAFFIRWVVEQNAMNERAGKVAAVVPNAVIAKSRYDKEASGDTPVNSSGGW